jgi:hypothetical protein
MQPFQSQRQKEVRAENEGCAFEGVPSQGDTFFRGWLVVAVVAVVVGCCVCVYVRGGWASMFISNEVTIMFGFC